MARLPIAVPLDGVSFEQAVLALSSDPGFVAVDSRRSDGGRFSIVASAPKHALAFSGGFVTIDGHTTIDSPAAALARFMDIAARMPADPYLPFSGGGVGYIGFEGARALRGYEPAGGFSRFPQCKMGIYATAAIFDHVEGTAFVVSNGTSEAKALREAQILKERLESRQIRRERLERRSEATSEMRYSPSDRNFKRMLGEAHLWLRSERVERIHIARHMTRPSPPAEAIEALIAGGPGGSTQAIFSHDGAFAIATSHGTAIEAGVDHPELAARRLMDRLPAPEFCGAPLKAAITFIGRNESSHRALYGGAFGTFDSRRFAFHAIVRSMTFVDDTVGVTAGVDVAREFDPSDISRRIDSMLALL